MIIVGCDFHPGWQQVAVFDSATGEIREEKLENGNGEAGRFYRRLPVPARVGFEARSTAVGKFVTAKAPENHKIQQLSTSSMQQVQYQSLTINRFQQVSPSTGIWFGIR